MALELHDKDEIETLTLLLTMMKVLNKEGEGHMTIDLQATAEALGLDQEHRQAIAMLLAGMVKAQEKLEGIGRRLVDELPDGVGEAYLLDPGFPTSEAYKVDLKTALRLADTRFRLDR